MQNNLSDRWSLPCFLQMTTRKSCYLPFWNSSIPFISPLLFFILNSNSISFVPPQYLLWAFSSKKDSLWSLQRLKPTLQSQVLKSRRTSPLLSIFISPWTLTRQVFWLDSRHRRTYFQIRPSLISPWSWLWPPGLTTPKPGDALKSPMGIFQTTDGRAIPQTYGMSDL